MGPENVLAVMMPYKTSSEATASDSRLVIERLGVRSLEVPITTQIDAYFAQFPEVKAYMDQTVAEARTKGHVTTLLNRRRPLPGLARFTPASEAAGDAVPEFQ